MRIDARETQNRSLARKYDDSEFNRLFRIGYSSLQDVSNCFVRVSWSRRGMQAWCLTHIAMAQAIIGSASSFE